MRHSEVPAPQYPCVFQIARAWQISIGGLHTGLFHLNDLETIFVSVPRPTSYVGAVMAAHALNTLFLDFGRAYDRRFHQVVHSDRCKFDCDHCYAYVRVRPDSWTTLDIGTSLARWTAAFGAAFTAAHGHDIAARCCARFAAGADGRITRAADDLACSPATFRRRFKTTTGMRPIDARTRARVIEAFVLLRTTTWKVEAIALRVGWKSPKAIYDAFEKLLQMKPAAVRELSTIDAATIFERIGGDPARLQPLPDVNPL